MFDLHDCCPCKLYEFSLILCKHCNGEPNNWNPDLHDNEQVEPTVIFLLHEPNNELFGNSDINIGKHEVIIGWQFPIFNDWSKPEIQFPTEFDTEHCIVDPDHLKPADEQKQKRTVKE